MMCVTGPLFAGAGMPKRLFGDTETVSPGRDMTIRPSLPVFTRLPGPSSAPAASGRQPARLRWTHAVPSTVSTFHRSAVPATAVE